ncbi:MAG: hypothetical protein ACRCXZ_08960 [Patescibacteria group bacterium]
MLKVLSIFKNKRKFVITFVTFLLFLSFFVFQSVNPLIKIIQGLNTSALQNKNPELFVIDLNLDEMGYGMIALDELKNSYSDQKCYLKSNFSNEELSSSKTGPLEDFDGDGLSNEIEMIYNSNPKLKQTQPGFDDLVLFQDSKSPFNSKFINKDKYFILKKELISNDTKNLTEFLNESCENGVWFFELLYNEQLYSPTKIEPSENPTKPQFEYFSQKEIEIAKNSEIDIFLTFSKGKPELIDKMKLELKNKIIELNLYRVEKENKKYYMDLYDFYNKYLSLLDSQDKETQKTFYKEILFILKQI